MFSRFRKAPQARRRQAPRPSEGLRWRKSWNALLLLPLLALGGNRLAHMDTVMPIRAVELVGRFEHLDRADIEAELRPFIGQGFFSLDIHDIRRRLHSRSWTASVSVRRIWPDRARVTLVERRPVARWDAEHLLSDEAVVYRADPSGFDHLPRIYAAGGRSALALERFRRLRSRFAEVGETLVGLSVDNRGATDVELAGGLEVKLGRERIEHKVARLVRIYRDEIQPRRAGIARLDLRYSNGFAVAWKHEVLTRTDKASIWSNGNV